jgi:hypothetical protein
VEEVGRIVERWRRRAKIRGWFVGEDRVVLLVEDPAEVPANLAAELEAAAGRRVEVVKGKIYLNARRTSGSTSTQLFVDETHGASVAVNSTLPLETLKCPVPR